MSSQYLVMNLLMFNEFVVHHLFQIVPLRTKTINPTDDSYLHKIVNLFFFARCNLSDNVFGKSTEQRNNLNDNDTFNH